MNYLQPELTTAYNQFKNSGAILGNYLSNLSQSDKDVLEMYWAMDGKGTESILSYAEKIRKGQYAI